MKILHKKLARDLRGQRGQLLALVVVQALGVTLFGASYAGYLNLGESYENTKEQLALAAVHAGVDGAGLDDDDVARVAAAEGVARAAGRSVFIAPLDLSPAKEDPKGAKGPVIDARVISLPDDGQPPLDRLHLVDGSLPRSAHGIVVETHLAAGQHLRVGDHLLFRSTLGGPVLDGADDAQGTGAGAAADVDVVIDGIAVSPEYLWVARDAQDPMPTTDTFGVVWAPRAFAAEIARAVVDAAGRAAPEDAVLAAHRRYDELLYDRAAGVRASDVDAHVDAALGPHKIQVRTEANELVGPQLLQLDVDGMRVMALFFPIFFLGVAGFISLALLARIVDQQRQVIGTLRALGLSRAAVVRHTVAFGAVVGGAASVFGAAVGALLSRALTETYAQELGIPFVSAGLHAGVIGAGLGAGLVTSLVASLVPSWRASQIEPAEAMRPARPDAGALVRMSRKLGGLPLLLRLPVRNALRHPLRAIAAAIGVVCALVLVLATVASAQSITRVADVQLKDAQRYDVRVDLGAPLPAPELARLVDDEKAHGVVQERELSLTLPVSVRHDGVARSVLLSCVSDHAKLLRPVDFDGVTMHAGDGILLPRGEAKKLHASVGDVVDVVLDLPGGLPPRKLSLTVRGVVETALGPVATMDLDQARRRFDIGDIANTVVATGPDAHVLRDKLRALPGAVGFFDAAALRDQLDQLLAINIAMVGFMLVFAFILGGAILSTMAMLSILERSRELATLRAVGMPVGRIAVLTTIENGISGLLGVLIGLPVAHAAARKTVVLFDSDLMAMPFVWSWSLAIVAAVVVVLVLLVAQAPALRMVAKLDLAASVRARE